MTSIIDEILTKVGLKYDDLNTIERETLNTWLESLSKNALTLETVKEYIASMRDGVEVELTKTTNGSKEDTLLKARLRNYMLLEAFMSSPEKAKKALDRQLAGIVSKKG